MNYIKILNKHLKKYGQKGFLPQNLTISLLHRMLKEINSFKMDKGTPATTILMAVFILKSDNQEIDKLYTLDIELYLEDELMTDFNSYVTHLQLEELRRKKKIYIQKESLPTLDNIFDTDKKLNISGFD